MTGAAAESVTTALVDGAYAYWPDFLTRAEADAAFETLSVLPDWKRETLRMFGRTRDAPRLTAYYGDAGADYRYSGLVHEPLAWTPCLVSLRERVSEHVGQPFNSVLANLYRDGRDSLGWHSDNEPELGGSPTIASLSLGARRRFRMRHRERRDLEPVALELEHGSLLVMYAATQHHWKHCVPKMARCRAPRINLTFRQITLR